MSDRNKQYQEQSIKSATPEELITKLYDFVISACHNKDAERLQDVLQALMESLNFDYDISESLYNLYEYCMRQAQQKNFEEVCELIEPLRETWINEVVNSNEQAAVTGGKGFVV